MGGEKGVTDQGLNARRSVFRNKQTFTRAGAQARFSEIGVGNDERCQAMGCAVSGEYFGDQVLNARRSCVGSDESGQTMGYVVFDEMAQWIF
jgi:hypothetical protein